MSTIPNTAIPHAYAHDDEGDDAAPRPAPSTGMLVGGAVVAYLLYRILR
jgi:hypothetical protein